MSRRLRNLDPDYQDAMADARCLNCDRHLGLGSHGRFCGDCWADIKADEHHEFTEELRRQQMERSGRLK